ncbi:MULTISPECIES: hypothetical protein [unclassified Mycobacterium]|uniref:hypothetical protein n=1 Tax=unclassified Mycobacterium TaxID=2642494 RepID=UPI000800689F|nr:MULTISPECIES: hypothetical protein [unclassified Mycobacterium]OBG59286.1 hypothetical protein A5703_26935 [Mycobacterium sp. E188]OBG61611.1 hypothetical protein A5704_17975 [Mycobacterium sp. E735]OBG72732.1 hypothetical protein A5701_25405 [Mycobacterium sp. E3305]OBG86284.1 hypothetical protein A9X05_15930 [Mycobacterium sp. E3298]OBH13345.1 hypothetical protein A9X03_24835 [Mycobacterium sp. E1715]
MAPLACDATALDRAGATVLATGESMGSVISALTAALACSAGTSFMATETAAGGGTMAMLLAEATPTLDDQREQSSQEVDSAYTTDASGHCRVCS